MTDFIVVIVPSAEEDITESFLWGCEFWGVETAIDRVNDLRTAIEEQLSRFPNRFARAPDDDGTDRELRQFLAGRYRVIFHIREETVFVIHVRGPFSGLSDNKLGVE